MRPGETPPSECAAPARRPWAALEGRPDPLGATWIADERAYNFALYSAHARRVTLLLFRPDDAATPCLARELDFRRNKTARVWHCRIPEAELGGARYYAYTVDGPPPEGRFAWHAFDADKLLLDPYGRAVHFPAAFDRWAAMRPGSNAGKAALSVLPAPAPPTAPRRDAPRHHDGDTVVYELHVRGFTRHPDSGVADERRGTYLGVVDRIPYLLDLGVTAVELMPVFQFDPQDGNYWGYMPIGFFAPHARYATAAARHECTHHDEFRAMVDALHAAGIEVILDVVYNHTAERDETGPTYSFRGIDNSTFYLMTGDPAHPYADYSGTGNTLHTANAFVRRMVMDSLRYWVSEMGVDGFRFDLASIFARRSDGSIDIADPKLFAEISSDPVLAGVRLIAEPWDVGGAYQLGPSLPGLAWLQWNDRFRDDLRRFVRGDAGLVPAVMTRLYGSDDLFPDDVLRAGRPWQSVNYITSHDGSTLYDLLAYTRKRNWANGLANMDGPAESFGSNCGAEGDDAVPGDVARLRRRQARNFAALLLLANGTPMIRAGDEFLQTQGGNDNPFNQDNETSWLDWRRLDAERDVFRFFRRMIAFRKAHPSLGRSRFWRDDVRWHGPDGPVDLGPDSRALAFFLDGRAEQDRDLFVMANMSGDDLSFSLADHPGPGWRRALDTSLDPPDDISDPGAEPPVDTDRYTVRARSVAVLLRA
ncbi:MAG TPA: isoamylase [Longimicrobiales bacterium]|nr:isoamylase [Longimicrobiales bacterium]